MSSFLFTEARARKNEINYLIRLARNGGIAPGVYTGKFLKFSWEAQVTPKPGVQFGEEVKDRLRITRIARVSV